MKSIFKVFLIVLICAALNNVNAQISGYTFSHSVGSYTQINGGTVLGIESNDNRVFNNKINGAAAPDTDTGFPIGFNFSYNQQVYDKFAVGTNGFIKLGTGEFTIGNSNQGILASSGEDKSYVIAGLNQDLVGQTGAQLRYQTIGVQPNRILVVQWTGYKMKNTPETMSLNFQIRLHESGNKVEVMYGTMSLQTGYLVQVGLKGHANIDVTNRHTISNWAATETGVNNSATCALGEFVYPLPGTTFTWLPPSCFVPSDFITDRVKSTSLRIRWTSPQTPPANGYDYYISTSMTPPLNNTPPTGSTAAGITEVTINNLMPSQFYYYWVRSKCGANNNSVWAFAGGKTTQCAPIPVPTEVEGFDDFELPVCWNTEQISGTTAWTAIDADQFIEGPHNGNSFLYKDREASEAIAISQPYSLVGISEQLRLNFYAHRHADANTNDLYRIYVNTVPDLAGASLVFTLSSRTTANPAVPSTGWYNYRVDLPVVYLGFPEIYIMIVGRTTVPTLARPLGIDDFVIEDKPDCSQPYNLYANQITQVSANAVWTGIAPDAVLEYQYYYSTSPTPPNSMTVPSGTTMPSNTFVSLNGLTMGTRYYFWVRSKCNTSDHSEWAAMPYFTTAFPPPANDNCSGAVFISNQIELPYYTSVGTMNGATISPNVPNNTSCNQLSSNEDV